MEYIRLLGITAESERNMDDSSSSMDTPAVIDPFQWRELSVDDLNEPVTTVQKQTVESLNHKSSVPHHKHRSYGEKEQKQPTMPASQGSHVHSVQVMSLLEAEAGGDTVLPVHQVLSFRSFGLSEDLLNGLSLVNIKAPLLLQEVTLPLVLKVDTPSDVVVQAPNGSGKTVTCILSMIGSVNISHFGPHAVCCTSSVRTKHILAQLCQVAKYVQGLDMQAIVPGVDPPPAEICRAHIMVGTPSKILGLLRKRQIIPSNVKVFMVDLADKMTDKGRDKTASICQDYMPTSCQRLITCCSFPGELFSFAKRISQDSVVVRLLQDQSKPAIHLRKKRSRSKSKSPIASRHRSSRFKNYHSSSQSSSSSSRSHSQSRSNKRRRSRRSSSESSSSSSSSSGCTPIAQSILRGRVIMIHRGKDKKKDKKKDYQQAKYGTQFEDEAKKLKCTTGDDTKGPQACWEALRTDLSGGLHKPAASSMQAKATTDVSCQQAQPCHYPLHDLHLLRVKYQTKKLRELQPTQVTQYKPTPQSTLAVSTLAGAKPFTPELDTGTVVTPISLQLATPTKPRTGRGGLPAFKLLSGQQVFHLGKKEAGSNLSAYPKKPTLLFTNKPTPPTILAVSALTARKPCPPGFPTGTAGILLPPQPPSSTKPRTHRGGLPAFQLLPGQQNFQPKRWNCPMGHSLQPQNDSSMFDCDLCNMCDLQTTPDCLNCIYCDYDVCGGCVSKIKVSLCPNYHPLRPANVGRRFRCKVCQIRNISSTPDCVTCLECAFDVCSGCKTRDTQFGAAKGYTCKPCEFWCFFITDLQKHIQSSEHADTIIAANSKKKTAKTSNLGETGLQVEPPKLGTCKKEKCTHKAIYEGSDGTLSLCRFHRPDHEVINTPPRHPCQRLLDTNEAHEFNPPQAVSKATSIATRDLFQFLMDVKEAHQFNPSQAFSQVPETTTKAANQKVPVQAVKDCASYMKHGVCGFRNKCMYNHPPAASQALKKKALGAALASNNQIPSKKSEAKDYTSDTKEQKHVKKRRETMDHPLQDGQHGRGGILKRILTKMGYALPSEDFIIPDCHNCVQASQECSGFCFTSLSCAQCMLAGVVCDLEEAFFSAWEEIKQAWAGVQGVGLKHFLLDLGYEQPNTGFAIPKCRRCAQVQRPCTGFRAATSTCAPCQDSQEECDLKVAFNLARAQMKYFRKAEGDHNPRSGAKEECLDQFPATLTEYAAPFPGDSREVCTLRPLLKHTNLEKRALKLVYDANKTGWSAKAFHKGVNRKGPGVVIARTKGGAIVGGYNPKGWIGQAEYRSGVSAFLFTWPDGDVSKHATKLRKARGAGLAIIDKPEQGPMFGPDGLCVPMAPNDERGCRCSLGVYYELMPDGTDTLFAPGEGQKTQLLELRAYVGVYAAGEEIPFEKKLVFVPT